MTSDCSLAGGEEIKACMWRIRSARLLSVPGFQCSSFSCCGMSMILSGGDPPVRLISYSWRRHYTLGGYRCRAAISAELTECVSSGRLATAVSV